MKKRTLNSLGLVICLGLIVGCSSVKPAHPQTATEVVPTVQLPPQPKPPSQPPQPTVPHYSWWNNFYHGWIGGEAPPPEFKEEDKTGIATWLGVAYLASITGWLIAGGGR
jgi:hypothetical protein